MNLSIFFYNFCFALSASIYYIVRYWW